MEALSIEIEWLVFNICKDIEYYFAVRRLMTM